jgi:heme-degrading monooxygenase HmoA
MTEHHLAQCNIARLRAPLDSPQLAGFVDALGPVNALADDAPGFVWRLQTEDGDATSIRAFDDDMLLINMSVWESVEALAAFVYSAEHREVMRGRRQWFERMSDAYLVLWWVPAGARPTPTDARERLDALRRNGPSPDAFTFRQPYPPPGAGDAPLPARDEWYCTL